jgi:glutamine synthetase
VSSNSDRLDSAKSGVLETCRKENVSLIELQFVDILGTTKSLTIPTERVEDALENGVGFDGSSIEGFVRIFEGDMIARPDPTTFQIIPWRPSEKKEGRIICDIYRPGGQPFEGDPRLILKRAIAEAERDGFTYLACPELEFFLFRSENGPRVEPVPHDVGGYFDLSPLDQALDVRRDAVFALDQMGLKIEKSHHEVAPGQHEIDFEFADALTTADKTVTYKNTIKAVAIAHGIFATFMPKPFFGVNGSGMHTHQSLSYSKNGRNAFYDANDKYNLSEVAYHFIGGQLKNARAMSAVLGQTVNSYKRLVPGYEAPVYICWGRRNRSALIRVPEYFPGRESATRFELRCPDPSCNPYLAFAVMLKAGLDGVRRKIEPPQPVEEDVYEFDDKKLAEFYIETLPGSLGEAMEEFRRSGLMKETLGEYAHSRFLAAKTKEWDEYRLQVTRWELERYLKM